jgi:hypothetical protein
MAIVPEAWSRFQNGDGQGYAQEIANYIVEHYMGTHGTVDEQAIVLSQASISPAEELV